MTLKGLQILRFIACIFVVYCHLKVSRMVGYFSIDIFFIISGFVISMIIMRPKQTVPHFIKGRIARILPLYWGLTLVLFAIAWVAPSLLNSTTANFGNLLKSLLFIPYRKENGIIDPILAVGWTLNFEILFYIVCAFSLLVAVPKRPYLIALVLGTIYTLSNLFVASSVQAEFYSMYFMVVLVIGVFAHHVYVRNQAFFVLPWHLGCIIVVALLGWLIYADYTRDWHSNIQYLLGFTLPALLLVLTVLSLERYIGDNWLVRFTVYMGDASFSVYLVHVFVIEAMRKLLPHLISGFTLNSVYGVILTYIACFSTGAVLDYCYDKPMVKRVGAYLKK